MTMPQTKPGITGTDRAASICIFTWTCLHASFGRWLMRYQAMTNLLRAETNASPAYNLPSSRPAAGIDRPATEALPCVLLIDEDANYREPRTGDRRASGSDVPDL